MESIKKVRKLRTSNILFINYFFFLIDTVNYRKIYIMYIVIFYILYSNQIYNCYILRHTLILCTWINKL